MKQNGLRNDKYFKQQHALLQSDPAVWNSGCQKEYKWFVNDGGVNSFINVLVFHLDYFRKKHCSEWIFGLLYLKLKCSKLFQIIRRDAVVLGSLSESPSYTKHCLWSLGRESSDASTVFSTVYFTLWLTNFAISCISICMRCTVYSPYYDSSMQFWFIAKLLFSEKAMLTLLKQFLWG